MSSGTNYSASFYDNLARDEDVIEKTAADFPFSSLAQYLRLYNSRKKDDAGFENLLKKTVLYFNNPHWLQFQLSQLDNSNGGFIFRQDAHDNIPSESGANHFAIVTDEQLSRLPETDSIGSEVVEPEIDSENPEDLAVDQHANTFDNANAEPGKLQVDTKEEVIPQVIEENETPATEQHRAELNVNNFAVVEKPEPLPHTQHLGIDLENVAEEREAIPHTQHLGTNLENLREEPTEIDNWALGNDDALIPECVAEQQTEAGNGLQPEEIRTITVADQGVQTETSEINNEQDASTNNEANAETKTEIPNNEPAVMQPDVANENAIAFEPLHTVDYFASQGIKITDEALGKDKLGTQMKSFTDWLKSMKKLHPASLPVENSLAEDIIQSAAEVSNIDTEILTEAMAEVLIKQDKKEKAIEMYNKLSLINPSKSAYFAAKIESIKST